MRQSSNPLRRPPQSSPRLAGDEREETARPGNSDHGAVDIPTYYDLPALKQSFYGWKVSTYILIAGIAGSSQILAAVAEFTDAQANAERYPQCALYRARRDRSVGAALLIIDLHTPTRFYNMLRIFRPTSPMSIGSYVLTSFGALSAVAGRGAAPT